MEYITEKEQKVKKLSEEEKLSIAKRIVEDFDTFNRARERQLEIAKLVSDEIYFRNVAKKEKDESKKWKSVAKMCKTYMFAQILKAFIWKNTYANTKSMFDVAGASLESDENSNKQKAMLVNCMESMEFPKTLDKIIDASLPYGEIISFTTWRKKSEEYRRPISFFDAMQNLQDLPKMIAAKQRGEQFYIDEKVSYNNPYTYDVDPANFVFDAAQSDDFDACPKINRTWRTPDYIINNKYFEVSKEVVETNKELFNYAPFKKLFTNALQTYGDKFTSDDAKVLMDAVVELKEAFYKEFEKQSGTKIANDKAIDKIASINTQNNLSAPAASQFSNADLEKMSDEELAKVIQKLI